MHPHGRTVLLFTCLILCTYSSKDEAELLAEHAALKAEMEALQAQLAATAPHEGLAVDTPGLFSQALTALSSIMPGSAASQPKATVGAASQLPAMQARERDQGSQDHAAAAAGGGGKQTRLSRALALSSLAWEPVASEVRSRNQHVCTRVCTRTRTHIYACADLQVL